MFKSIFFSSIIFLILTLLLCSFAEIVFLEKTHGFLQGGYGQPYGITTFIDRVKFFSLYIFFNIILYGGGFLLWQSIFKRFDANKNVMAFHYMMIAGIMTAIYLVVTLQLQKYFADVVNVTLIKNVAGGSIKTALIYVLDEAVLFIVGLFLMIGVYYLISRYSQFLLKKFDKISNENKSVFNLKPKFSHLTAILVIAGIAVVNVNSNENLRRNLGRVNSFQIIAKSLNTASDFDFDGYGYFSYPNDIDMFDANIYPGALDIPNNGIDENGLYGDFANYYEPYDLTGSINPQGKPKNVVVIFLESTRSEVIGKRIGGKLVAPNLFELSKQGSFYDDVYSHTGMTSTSVTTFFSGNLSKFSEEKSLYPILKDHGYEISVFSGQDEDWGGISDNLKMKENTDHFFDAQVGVNERITKSRRKVSIRLDEKTLWREFKEYSDTADWDKPQFVYFNMQAAHFPYYYDNMEKTFIDTGISRDQISQDEKDWLTRTYWNAVYHSDIYVGKILNELKEKGVWDDTLVIVTADHGEELYDDGHLGHGFVINDFQTRFPLLINQKQLKVDLPLGHVDMKNIIISNAINNSNDPVVNPNFKEKFVFQFLGTIEEPYRISLRYKNNQKIYFDFNTMSVLPKGENSWISYSDALKDEKISADLQTLINYWESLRWQAHVEDDRTG